MMQGGAGPRSSAEGQLDWHVVSALLETGLYERVAELLARAQTAGAQTGQAGLTQMLAAAQRICQACGQSRAEAEWHEQAIQEAGQRERDFRRQLQAILDLINGYEEPDTQEERGAPSALTAETGLPKLDTPLSSEHPSLWPHMKTSPRQGLDHPRSPERAPYQVSHAALAASPVWEKGEPRPPSLTVYCLGPFRVYQDDQLISNWPSGKGKCIFKYMIANHGRPIAKEVLMDLFWSDADPDAARNNLNVAIYGLRQAMRAGRPDFSHILFEDDHYLLNPAMPIWIDVEEFRRRYEAGRTLEKKGGLAKAVEEYEVADGLYQGDFLEEDLYQDWLIPRREAFKDSYLTILDRLSRYYLEERSYATCIYLCRRILAEDDCREDAHRRLMRCYSRQGQRNLALRQYHRCVETLARVLDVSPMPETEALYHHVRRGETI
jgi:DNA-binding SARP family transcriptional activator